MRTLHAAALAYPTHQGTQGALHAMLTALSHRGRNDSLLTYAHKGFDRTTTYSVERAMDWPPMRNERSGPSVRKLCIDMQLARSIRRAHRQGRYGLLIAHHVEAALASHLVWKNPWVFLAHTTLEHELPYYLNPSAQRFAGLLVKSAGYAVDGFLMKVAPAVGAVSPALSAHLTNRYGVPAQYVPIPWSVLAQHVEQHESPRKKMRIDDDAFVLLYSGNLDRYQNWQDLVPTIRMLRDAAIPAILIVASASQTDALSSLAHRAGVADCIRYVDLRDNKAASNAYAASDVAVIPRASCGGVPIKLLDALARGKPVMATHAACSGLPLAGVVLMSEGDGPSALVNGICKLVQNANLRGTLSEKGPKYIQTHHHEALFQQAIEALEAFAQDRLRMDVAASRAATNASLSYHCEDPVPSNDNPAHRNSL